LPLAEFTAARNALAAQLKKVGKAGEANAVKTLPKPSASAWVVNQLYWRHRESFNRLLAAGAKLRRAHAGQLTGDAVHARREAMAELTKLAELIVLRDGNHAATRDLMRRVTTTLEALSSYAPSAEAPTAGRLTDDLQPPGFEAMAGLLSETGKGKGRGQLAMALPHAEAVPRRASVAPRDEKDRKKLEAAAKAAVRDAERALTAARKQAERAAAKAETAAKRANEIEAQRAKIEKQLALASSDAKDAQAQATEAATGANNATKSVESAERALELARQRLQQTVGQRD
jgi:hypothetical protein